MRILIDLARRHAAPTMLLAGCLLAVPEARQAASRALPAAGEEPGPFLLAVLFAGVVMGSYTALSRRGLTAFGVLWIVYLLGVAVLEEWVFRMALPAVLMAALGVGGAHAVSAACFGALHRLTLGWSWTRCLLLAGAGLGLSGTVFAAQDLRPAILLHFAGAFVVFRPTWTEAGSADARWAEEPP